MAILCLHDQMRVIALERVVHEAELPALAPAREGLLDLLHEPHRAQRRNILPHSDRDMTREPASERIPRAVSQARARSRLAPGSGSSPAPSAAIELELFGFASHANMIGAIFIICKR